MVGGWSGEKEGREEGDNLEGKGGGRVGEAMENGERAGFWGGGGEGEGGGGEREFSARLTRAIPASGAGSPDVPLEWTLPGPDVCAGIVQGPACKNS